MVSFIAFEILAQPEITKKLQPSHLIVRNKVSYRVTHHVVQNLPLTAKQKLHFGLAWLGLARPKRNFCFEVNGRFWTT